MRYLALLTLLYIFASPVFAAPVLDQQNEGVVNSYLNGGGDCCEWQQEVTAGITGQLTQLDVLASILDNLGDPASTQVYINVGAPWQSDAHDWSTITTLAEGWNSFDLAGANIFLSAGDQFVIGIAGQGPSSGFNPGIAISYGNQYEEGALFLNGAPGTASAVNDINFRTYVSNSTLVTIDIKPGSDPNCFNVNGHGVIPVAILGETTLDVTTIDVDSLLFGGLQVRQRKGRALCSVEDVNNDDYWDLVCHFEDVLEDWVADEEEATLTGTLYDGTSIEGTDSICLTPKKGNKSR